MIRARNLAFDRLQRAVLACERKRHSSGSVPPRGGRFTVK